MSVELQLDYQMCLAAYEQCAEPSEALRQAATDADENMTEATVQRLKRLLDEREAQSTGLISQPRDSEMSGADAVAEEPAVKKSRPEPVAAAAPEAPLHHPTTDEYGTLVQEFKKLSVPSGAASANFKSLEKNWTQLHTTGKGNKDVIARAYMALVRRVYAATKAKPSPELLELRQQMGDGDQGGAKKRGSAPKPDAEFLAALETYHSLERRPDLASVFAVCDAILSKTEPSTVLAADRKRIVAQTKMLVAKLAAPAPAPKGGYTKEDRAWFMAHKDSPVAKAMPEFVQLYTEAKKKDTVKDAARFEALKALLAQPVATGTGAGSSDKIVCAHCLAVADPFASSGFCASCRVYALYSWDAEMTERQPRAPADTIEGRNVTDSHEAIQAVLAKFEDSGARPHTKSAETLLRGCIKAIGASRLALHEGPLPAGFVPPVHTGPEPDDEPEPEEEPDSDDQAAIVSDGDDGPMSISSGEEEEEDEEEEEEYQGNDSEDSDDEVEAHVKPAASRAVAPAPKDPLEPLYHCLINAILVGDLTKEQVVKLAQSMERPTEHEALMAHLKGIVRDETLYVPAPFRGGQVFRSFLQAIQRVQKLEMVHICQLAGMILTPENHYVLQARLDTLLNGAPKKYAILMKRPSGTTLLAPEYHTMDDAIKAWEDYKKEALANFSFEIITLPG